MFCTTGRRQSLPFVAARRAMLVLVSVAAFSCVGSTDDDDVVAGDSPSADGQVVAATALPLVNAHAGNWTAKANLATTASATTLAHFASTVAKSTTYTASVWVKGAGKLRLEVLNSGRTATLASVSITATSSWQKLSVPSFSTGTNATVYYQLSDSVGGVAGTVFIDDASLGPSSTGANVLGNAGFESGYAEWTAGGVFSIVQNPDDPACTNNVHAGSWGAKAVLASSQTWTKLDHWDSAVSRNTTYSASIWVKGKGNLRLDVVDREWDDNLASVIINATDSWQRFSVPDFDTGNNSIIHYSLYDQVGGTAGTVYLDDAFLGLPGGANLLSNPGFEEGSGEWASSGVFSVVQSPDTAGSGCNASCDCRDVGGNARTGSWAARAALASGQSWTKLTHYDTAVAANTTYVASVWVKGTGRMRLDVTNSNWSTNLSTVSFVASGCWQKFTVPSFSSGTNTTVHYNLYDEVGGTAGSIYIDDAFLGTPTGPNLLGNPSFESGDSEWIPDGVFSVLQGPDAVCSNDAHAGNWAAKAKLSSSQTWTKLNHYDTTVAANTMHTASVWIKGKGKLRLDVVNTNWTTNLASVLITATDSWQQYTVPDFNTGSNTVIHYSLYDALGGTDGTVYIDDAFLGRVDGPNLLANAGFETGAGSWTPEGVFSVFNNRDSGVGGCPGNCDCGDDGRNVHGGDFAAKASLSSSQTWTKLNHYDSNVTANTTYSASVWVKGRGNLTLQVANGNWTSALASVSIAATGCWQRYAVPDFNTGSNTVIHYSLYDELGGAAGTVFMDDAYLGLANGCGPNLLSNPGFETGSTNWIPAGVFSVEEEPQCNGCTGPSCGSSSCSATARCGSGSGPCTDSSQCESGLTCAFGVASRFGRPAGTGVCWNAAACATPSASLCGTTSSPCGTCCVPKCTATGAPDGCGGTCTACNASADSDDDGIGDCAEVQDGQDGTDPTVFNGVSAQLASSCHATPTCAAIDTFDELLACPAPRAGQPLRAGWDFSTTNTDACQSGFGFDRPWQQCMKPFSVTYSGAVRLESDGVHCFKLAGSTNNQCAALFFDNGAESTTTAGGTMCTVRGAGTYRLDWFYETANQTLNESRLQYCFGGTANCTPTLALPRRMLRPDVEFCTANGPCTEKCPCESGRVCTSDLVCKRDLVCRSGVADRFGVASSSNVCWDPACDDPSSPQFDCGSASALCGTCPACTPSCGGKSCGPDGCFGSCGDQCDAGEAGCVSDGDCAEGLACAPNPTGANTCIPEQCQDPGFNPCSDPANAGKVTECGTCPTCPTDCGNRACGLSPNGCGNCGTSTLGPTEYCTNEGQIVPKPLRVSDQLVADLKDGATTVGTLPGKFEVSTRGDATYTIPLQLPPGRHGIEPNLALSYNSSAGNGYLGMGWGLSGLSTIQRCPRTIAQDGAPAAITYTDSDRYCLDGNRLVPVDTSATYGAGGTEYRTEMDTFSKIILNRPAGATEPRSFTVSTAEGQVLTYDLREAGGYPRVANAYKPNDKGDSTPLRTQSWLLTQVKDRFGNSMRIVYANPAVRATGGGWLASIGSAISVAAIKLLGGPVKEVYPVRIEYVSHGALASDRRVDFFYRARRDLLSGYQGGVEFQRSKLLERISATTHGQKIFEYRFAYDEPDADSKGRATADQLQRRTTLTSAQQCARAVIQGSTDLTCKPPTVFEYEDVEPGFVLADGLESLGPRPILPRVPDAESDFVGAPLTLDMDGNGQDDVLYSECVHYTTQRCAEVAFPTHFETVCLVPAAEGSGCAQLGTREVADPRTCARFVNENCDKLEWRLALNGKRPDDSHNERTISRAGGVLSPASIYVLDYDLDGRDDVIEVDNTNRTERNATLRKWSYADGRLSYQDLSNISIGGNAPYNSPLAGGATYVLDANGDGASDLLVCTPNYERQVVDRDYHMKPSGYTWRMWLNQPGVGFGTPITLQNVKATCELATPLDVDGDGAQELLLKTTPNGYQNNYNRNGVSFDLNDSSALLWPMTGTVTDTAIPAVKDRVVRFVLDANGDSLPDVVELSERYEVQTWLNTGRGFVSKKQTLSFPGAYSGKAFVRQLARFAQPFDENSDGRMDLLVRANDSSWIVLRSTGSKFVVRTLDGVTPPTLGDHFFVYDADHDGTRDLVVPNGATPPVFRHPTSELARLNVVTDGLGARTDVDYAWLGQDGDDFDGLPSEGVYRHSFDNCTYPTYCRHPSNTVVRRHAIEGTGLGAAPSRGFVYSYGGSALDLNGRGWLGFGERRIVDQARMAATPNGEGRHLLTLSYPNKQRFPAFAIYPCIDRVQVSTDESTTALGRERLDVVARTWGEEGGCFPSNPTPRSLFVGLRAETRVTVEHDPGDTSGSVLSQVTDDWFYDKFGNPTLISTQWLDGATSRIDTSFATDQAHVDQWLIRQPVTRTVVAQGRGGSGMRSTRYVYPEDTGAPGGGIAFSGLPVSIIAEPDDAAHKLETRYGYNQFGNVVQIEEIGQTTDGAQTRRTGIEYDALELFPDLVTERKGLPGEHAISLIYDQGLGLPVERSEIGRVGVPVTERTIPDGFGRIRRVVNADGTDVRTRYTTATDAAMATRSQRTGFPEESVFHDAFGRDIRHVFQGFDRTLTEDWTYDARGYLASESRPHASGADPQATTLTYDAQGYPLLRDLPDTTVVEQCHYDNAYCAKDGRGYTSCEVRDQRSQVVHAVQARNDTTTACADVARDVAEKYPSDADPAASTGYAASRYLYDGFGETWSIRDSAGNTTALTRDGYGRPLSVNDPDSGSWQYTYNAFGEPETEVNPLNDKSVHHYDELGRQIKRTDLATTRGDAQQDTLWLWDFLLQDGFYGQLIATVTPGGAANTTLGYDQFGRLSTFTRSFATSGGGTETLKRTHTYDTSGRLSTLSYDSARGSTQPLQLEYRYNTNGYLNRVAPPGTIATSTGHWSAVAGDTYGQLAQERFGNTLVTQRTYKPVNTLGAGKLDVLRTTNGSTVVQDWQQSYDANGNLETRSNRLSGSTGQTQYVYDELNRLKSAEQRLGTTLNYREAYTYDSTGNILTKVTSGPAATPAVNWTYNYNNGTGKPHAVKTIASATRTQTFVYDATGVLKTRSAGETGMPSSLDIGYDRLNLPKRVGSAAGSADTINLIYDAEGNRARKTATGADTFYLDDFFSRTRTGGTSFVERLVVSNGSRAVAEITRQGATDTFSFLHEDELGSLELVTNGTGGVAQRREYDAFGLRRSTSGTTPTGTRPDFAGHELDAELGLINMKARLYDPRVGRFLAPDPLLAVGDNQGLNSFSYVRNQPTRLTDPFGMEPCDELSGKCQPPPPGCTGACDPNAALQILKAVGRSFVGLVKSVAIPFKAIGQWFESSPPVHGTSPGTFNAASDRSTKMDAVREFASEFFGGVGDYYGGAIPDNWSTARLLGASLAAGLEAGAAYRNQGSSGFRPSPGMSMGIRPRFPRMTAPSVPRTSTALPKGTRFVRAVAPGPYAGRSIPARGPQRDFTRAERDQLNEIGAETGCHTCGTPNPGTKTGDFVGDHQPPNSLNPTGADQRLFPQCLRCSKVQGGELRTLQREMQ